MSGAGDVIVVELDETSSTQVEARRLVDEGAAHGTAVLARRQQAARGRRGREWSSLHEGLWLSLVVRPDVPMALAPRLPLVACAAVLDVLRGRGLDVWIKWPNDVLVPTTAAPSPVLGPFRKAGGLLVEAVDVKGGPGAPRLGACVLGLGLNLWRPAEGFGALEGHAGALEDVGFVGDDGARRDLAAVLAQALARSLRGERSVDDDAFAEVRRALMARSATLGRVVTVDGVKGRAVDLDAHGALVLEDDEGRRQVVSAGDVSVWSEALRP